MTSSHLAVYPYDLEKKLALQLITDGLLQLFPETNAEQFQRDEVKAEIFSQLTPTPNLDQGHLCWPSFKLSKELSLKPFELTQLLEKKLLTLQASLPPHQFKLLVKVKAQGPYLNFFFDDRELLWQWHQQLRSGQFFQQPLLKNSFKTMIEYSQPNTHKEMHVGHLRNVALGLSLSGIYRYVGVDLTTATYPGDQGTHVAKTLWYLQTHRPAVPEQRKGAWLGKIYQLANDQLERERGSAQEDINRQALTAILEQLQRPGTEIYQQWQETRQWSIDLMKEVYEWCQVSFDYWFFESQVDGPSLELVDQYYRQGLFKLDQGAIGIDLQDYGLGFCLLKKQDGQGLYATKDLALAQLKFATLGLERNIYIVDVRQSHHFKQVFKTLELMGFEQASRCVHLGYEMVELPDGPMSSRKGNIAPLQELISELQETIKQRYLLPQQQLDTVYWTDSCVQQTAHLVACSALKYGMIRIDPGKKIVFDREEWLSLQGPSGPYLLYSLARANSLLKGQHFSVSKAGDGKDQELEQMLFSGPCFEEKAEKELLASMLLFHGKILEAYDKNAPSIFAYYLYQLAQQFNTFYAQCPVGRLPPGALKQARLLLIHSFSILLDRGLRVIGIEPIERL